MATRSKIKPKDNDIIRDLALLLRQNGERILSGQSKLSLTTQCLCILNNGFALLPGEDEFQTSFDVLPPNSPKLPFAQDIQFLYDFVQKTVALKVMHSMSTLQGRINLGPFRALRTLEIKKTPLHLLEGIGRMRVRLQTIVCCRCLLNLQELFEASGGDLTIPMTWPELRIACLSFNMIECLDSSLRLLPVLDVLDLSHNLISETDNCLEYLEELSLINLGYNKLREVPSFSISARVKLTTIILRNNNLDSLQGIEELVGLRELDVCDNCMSDHQVALHPLKALHRLSVLILEGNPLYFHSDHRLLTIGQLNATAAPRVTLNGSAVSQSELQGAQRLVDLLPKVTSIPTQKLRPDSPGVASESDLNTSQESRTLTDNEVSVKSNIKYKKSKKGGKTSKKVRRVLISDLESGGEPEPELEKQSPQKSKDSSPQTSEHLDVKKHMEIMRNQLGPDWLQTLVHNKVSTNEATQRPSPNTVTVKTSPESKPARRTEKQIPLVQSEEEPLSESRLAHFEIGSVDSGRGFLPVPSEDLHDFEKLTRLSPQALTADVTRKTSLQPRECELDQTDRLSDHLEMDKDERRTHHDEADFAPLYRSQSSEIETIYDKKNDSEREEVDFGAESDLFIVSLLNSDVEKLITVTQRYLLEKDINGDLLDALDLQCLLSVEVGTMATQASEMIVSDGNGNYQTLSVMKHETTADEGLGPVVKLLFDYVKRDRRERHYIMEDDNCAKMLYDLLQPAVEHNKAQAVARDQMHCVKCGKDFSRQQARLRVRSKGMVSSMLNDVYSSSAEKGDLEEVMLCPHCCSDMVLEVNVGHRSKGSTVNTPIGSFKEPMATSSANPSPWKRTESPRLQEDNQSLLSSSFKSAFEASSYGSAVEISTVYKSAVQSTNVTVDTSQPSLSATIFSDVNSSTIPGMSWTDQKTSEGRSVIDSKSGEVGRSVDGRKQSYKSQSTDKVLPQNNERVNVLERNSSPLTENRALPTSQSKEGMERLRKRQDSGSSDILVLSRHPHQVLRTTPSQDSDITLLTNPSVSSSIAVINSETSSQDALDDVDGESVFQPCQSETVDIKDATSWNHDRQNYKREDHSPAESLTSKTLTSMVNTVYEKSIFDSKNNFSADGVFADGNTTADSVDIINSFKSTLSLTPTGTSTNPFGDPHSDLPTPVVAKRSLFPSNGSGELSPQLTPLLGAGGGVMEDPSKARYWYDDFTQVDHRLKLHFTMSLFTQKNEDFCLLIRSGLIQYTKGEEVTALLVVSTHNMYFLKVTGDESAGQPDKWLKLIQTQPVTELHYLDIGLGCQTLRLEFSAESSCFTLMIRDEQRCQKFLSQLLEHIEELTFGGATKLEGISKHHPQTAENLHTQVLVSDGDDSFDDSISRYLLCYQTTGEIRPNGERSRTPVSLLVTPSHLHLICEDFRWPPPRCAPGAATKGQQFTLKDKQKITDIAQMDLFKSVPKDVAIVFYDEQSSEECTWRITMETDNALLSLVEAVREPWESLYGVELQINVHDDSL